LDWFLLDWAPAGLDTSRVQQGQGLEKEQVLCSAGETPAIQKVVYSCKLNKTSILFLTIRVDPLDPSNPCNYSNFWAEE
jgi:hypothetical protein